MLLHRTEPVTHVVARMEVQQILFGQSAAWMNLASAVFGGLRSREGA